MDPRLLDYYNKELQYLREMGQEFSKEFPKVAGRLGIETLECADPYVERLLESFAFLTARVQLKIDSEFPRFSQHLLQLVYPHYLSPLPSFAIVQIEPNYSESALFDGFKIPRGTSLRGHVSKTDRTACEYRTAHEITLYPIKLVEAEYSSFLGPLSNLNIPHKLKSAIRLKLRTSQGAKFNRVKLSSLPVYLPGSDEVSTQLIELILQHTVGLLVRPGSGKEPKSELVLENPVSPVGFDDEDALLPYPSRSFHGFRILQEYFAFPARFSFIQVNGLARCVSQCMEEELEIFFLLDSSIPRLEKSVGTSQFSLFCSPIVNLFPKRVDRISVSDSKSEFHVVADRTRPMDFEVHSLQEVLGYGANNEKHQEFLPLYSQTSRKFSHEGFYTTRRTPRIFSTKQKEQGARSSYVGSEVYLSLVDPAEAPFSSDLKQLSVTAICSNRDLPLHLPVGVKSTDFTLESGAPINSAKCIAGPSPPKPSCAHADTAWRLLNHLSLNYLSLINDKTSGHPAALQELLKLYCDANDTIVQKQIDSIVSISSQSISRRLPFPGPAVFGRGLEISIGCDETGFQGSSAYLLGMALDHFFQNYVSINSFSETVLNSLQRGEIARWAPRLGLRKII